MILKLDFSAKDLYKRGETQQEVFDMAVSSNRNVLLDYILITLCCVGTAVVIHLFQLPNHFVFGGVTGMAVLLSTATVISFSTLNIAINLLLLVVGCIVDTTAAIIILAPMLYPLVSAYGVNLIHFGLIMVLNLAIGLCTPPVGANLFVASGLSGLPFNQVSKQVLPFLLVMLAVLMAVTFVPGITLLLPKLLGLPL